MKHTEALALKLISWLRLGFAVLGDVMAVQQLLPRRGASAVAVPK